MGGVELDQTKKSYLVRLATDEQKCPGCNISRINFSNIGPRSQRISFSKRRAHTLTLSG